jgi:crotonobetainyl-CoA:carnitine CoA-transferase CaiB-like acyl-CoA transferase
MTKVMKGVRVLEIAQHTFVPSAGAILADWGADVIKIEHPKRGDAMRGMIRWRRRRSIRRKRRSDACAENRRLAPP